jgi:transcription factor SFP1
MMMGTSPFAGNYMMQSPSFHSSSYLPKLEASFMKDFTCCGLTLPSLHDLLQHFEEAHAQQMPAPMAGAYPAQGGAGQASGAQGQQARDVSSAVNQLSSVQQQANRSGYRNPQQQQPQFKATALQPIQDMDALEDMEMDDVMDGGFDGNTNSQSQFSMQPQQQFQQRSQFGQQNQPEVPPLDMNAALNMGNPLQAFPGIRQSQPSTPVAGRPGGNFYNNPTVSSVNTPTLSAHPLHQQQLRRTPDSSAPGTPGELDPEFLGHIGNMSMDNNASNFLPQQGNFEFSGYNFGNNNELLDLCIDEPAKRLFSPNGAYNAQNNGQSRLGSAQYGPNSDIARRIREQQLAVGLADTVSGLNGEEPKPFRCPVIGCEKAYKNQNGLKYHKAVSSFP